MDDNATNALTKLAEDLTNRVDELEKENATLKAALETSKQEALAKKASEEPKVAQVSEATVDKTVAGLVKAGALEPDQAGESRKVFLTDPEAAHRVIQQMLDSQLQQKTASADDDLYGGRLVGNSPTQSAETACIDRMMLLLGMK